MKKALIAVAAAFLARDVAGTTSANTSGYRCGEKIAAVCEATAIKDPGERQRELYRRLELALFSDDAGTRYDALVFVRSYSHELDPRPLERALRHLDELDGDTIGQATLDQAAFARTAREEHRSVYAAAIENGKAPIGKVANIERVWAIEAASREGFAELRPLIEKYYSLVPENDLVAHNLPLDRIRASLELREGAQSEVDGNERAAIRLESMGPEELALKLEKSKGWRLAVSDVREATCRERDSQGCRAMTRVIQKQDDLLRAATAERAQRLAKTGQRGTNPELTEGEKIRQEWLAGRLR
ncbi:MAG: hypothetical protein IT186_16280 [Acidobacteria bacterium]|nr:hypothetical protein [Acidobacteriota bacterium]